MARDREQRSHGVPSVARTVTATAALVIAIALVLAALLVVVVQLRDTSRAAERSQESLRSAVMVEKLVVDAETGVRGFVITGQPRFLDPWVRSRAQLPAAEADLMRRVAGDRAQAARARAVSSAIGDYVEGYTVPLVALARRNPSAARTTVATTAGKRRVDAIRTGIATIDGNLTRLVAGRRARADRAARFAVGAAITGLVLLVVLGTLFALYVARAYGSEGRARRQVTGLQRLTAALAGARGFGAVAEIVRSQAASAVGASEAALAVRRDGRLEPLLPGASDELRRALAQEAADGWVLEPLAGGGGPETVLAIRFGDGAADRDELARAIASPAAQALEREGLDSARAAALDDAREARDRLALVASAGRLLAESLDYEATLQRVADLAVRALADWCGVDLVDEDGSLRSVAVAHVDPAKVELARDLRRRYPPDPEAPTGPPSVVRSGRSELIREVPDELLKRTTEDPEQLEAVRSLGIVSAMVVPLRAHERTLGAITFVSAESGRRYDEDDLRLAEELADRAALAIDNARLYRRERGIAETLQRSLLPERLPQLPQASLAAAYVPAESDIEVGGDWHDVIPLADGSLALVIGDVVGHGVQAAAVMGQLRSALRAYAAEGHPPAAAIERLNAMLAGSTSKGMVGTLLLLVYDPPAGNVRYASAGHLPPVARRPDGGADFLEGGRGTPLGVSAHARLDEAEATLARGSTVVLYTDGLVERRGEPLERGLERLRDAVARGPAEAEALRDFVLAELRSEGPSADDTALVVLHLTDASANHVKVALPAEPSAVPTARRAVAGMLEQWGAGAEECFELSVAVGDACANAVEHAYGMRAGVFEVEARIEGSDVAIEVRDFGRWRSPRGVHRGRGLRLIAAFTDELDVDRGEGGTTVRMRRRLRGGADEGGTAVALGKPDAGGPL